jgi:hypothetical protein
MSKEINLEPLLISQIERYALEPATTIGTSVQGFLKLLTGAGGSLLESSGTQMDPQFAAMIQEQIYWQYQMQLVSLISNVEKSKHECQMVALRNISVR